MKKYEHKAICEYCKKQEFDGTWIRGNGREFIEKSEYSATITDWHYICFRCIKLWFIQNDC